MIDITSTSHDESTTQTTEYNRSTNTEEEPFKFICPIDLPTNTNSSSNINQLILSYTPTEEEKNLKFYLNLSKPEGEDNKTNYTISTTTNSDGGISIECYKSQKSPTTNVAADISLDGEKLNISKLSNLLSATQQINESNTTSEIPSPTTETNIPAQPTLEKENNDSQENEEESDSNSKPAEENDDDNSLEVYELGDSIPSSML